MKPDIWKSLTIIDLAFVYIVSTSAWAQESPLFAECMTAEKNESTCFQRHGRNSWQPLRAEDCASLKSTIEAAAQKKLQQSWQNLFKNERCHRLGYPHFEALPK